MINSRMATSIGLVVSVVGIIVMVGWVFDIPALKSVLPIWVTMKFSTALSFFLSGITLFYICKSLEGEKVQAQVVLPITTLSILLLMTTLLASSLFDVETGVENLFVVEKEGAVQTTVPGRPSIGTMVNFILIAIAGILSLLEKPFIEKAYRLIGTAVGLIGVIAFIGYLLDEPSLYYSISGISTAMAFHTAILFIMLGLGLAILGNYPAMTNEAKSENL